MNSKAIFLDIDGTIVAHHQSISTKVKEAITKARENGHKVFICTGRNKAATRDELNQVTFDGIIASAGSYVEVAGKVIRQSFFSEKLVNKVTQVFNQNHILFNYECTNVTYMSEDMIKLFAALDNKEVTNSEMERLIAEHNEKFNALDLNEYDGLGVHKISFVAQKKADLLTAKSELENDVNFILHDLGNENLNGEIISKTDNKGTGIRYVVKYLNMDMQDTIAFGDSMNDYEMIDTVALGIVMENGSVELKKIADAICLSVEQDGVYDEFLKLGLI